MKVNKKLLGKAASLLLKTMLKALTPELHEPPQWIAAFHVIIRVKDGNIITKEATLNLLSDDRPTHETQVIDRELIEERIAATSTYDTRTLITELEEDNTIHIMQDLDSMYRDEE